MKTKTFNQVGSLHPILFFAVVYIVALVLSVFICSSLFYSCNASSAPESSAKTSPVNKESPSKAVVAMR
jgi:hypothetical protein